MAQVVREVFNLSRLRMNTLISDFADVKRDSRATFAAGVRVASIGFFHTGLPARSFCETRPLTNSALGQSPSCHHRNFTAFLQPTRKVAFFKNRKRFVLAEEVDGVRFHELVRAVVFETRLLRLCLSRCGNGTG